MELLIRVVSKSNPNSAEKDDQCTKRGDVIVAMPDGHNWGTKELSNPDWRIIKAPTLTAADVAPWLEPEETGRGRARKNGFALGSLSLPADLVTYLADATRKSPSYTTNITRASLLALKVIKE